jgi:hypothetical protein
VDGVFSSEGLKGLPAPVQRARAIPQGQPYIELVEEKRATVQENQKTSGLCRGCNQR